jgi:hypothetical protein
MFSLPVKLQQKLDFIPWTVDFYALKIDKIMYSFDSGQSFAMLSILHSQEQSALKYVTVIYLNSLEKICGTCLSEEVCMHSIILQHAQM